MNPNDLYLQTLKGGFTYHPSTNSQPDHGYAVAAYKSREEILDVEEVTPEVISAYIEKNSDVLADDQDAHVGSWNNQEDTTDKLGRFFRRGVYLDIVHVVEDRDEALAQCLSINDASIFDLGSFETIWVDEVAA